MPRLRSMAAFMKVNPYLLWGCVTSPVSAPAEKAATEIQKMVREVNLQHKPISVERFLDLAYFIRELRIANNGITSKLAAELTWILTREWERPWPMTPRKFSVHTFAMNGRVPRG